MTKKTYLTDDEYNALITEAKFLKKAIKDISTNDFEQEIVNAFTSNPLLDHAENNLEFSKFRIASIAKSKRLTRLKTERLTLSTKVNRLATIENQCKNRFTPDDEFKTVINGLIGLKKLDINPLLFIKQFDKKMKMFGLGYTEEHLTRNLLDFLNNRNQ